MIWSVTAKQWQAVPSGTVTKLHCLFPPARPGTQSIALSSPEQWTSESRSCWPSQLTCWLFHCDVQRGWLTYYQPPHSIVSNLTSTSLKSHVSPATWHPRQTSDTHVSHLTLMSAIWHPHQPPDTHVSHLTLTVVDTKTSHTAVAQNGISSANWLWKSLFTWFFSIFFKGMSVTPRTKEKNYKWGRSLTLLNFSTKQYWLK